MSKLTKRQQEILNLIESHMASMGSPPTRAEIAKTMGFRSPNAAEDHLRALARKGVIELVPGTSRGIRLTQTSGIPIIAARLQSKGPLLAEEHIIGRSRIDHSLFQPRIDFLLQVTGSQWQNHHILNGDYLAIHQTTHPKPNQWVVLRQNNELAIRSFSTESQIPPSTIEGIIVGIIRSFTGSLHKDS